MISKFSTFGEGVVAASLLVLECPDNTIHLGPAIKGLLPGIYKVANHKELPGIGMTAKLESKEGREALKDKDIKSIAPIEKVDDKKGDKAAPAAAGGGGGDGGGGGGGGGGEASGDGGGGGGGGGDDAPAAEGEAESSSAAEVEGFFSFFILFFCCQVEGGVERPVSVVNKAQCCGSLKSGVCRII